MHGGQQAALHRAIGPVEHRLERRDHVADHIFGGVMEKRGKALGRGGSGVTHAVYALDQQAMLGDGEGVIAGGLAVPAGDAREPVRNISDLDVERRRIQQVQAPA
jgi:hypothetical protein